VQYEWCQINFYAKHLTEPYSDQSKRANEKHVLRS
jgi:hypothetical protein